ncbi:MAG: hypothetical protein PHO02_01715 [Candidatus Nanoarchaeia archaeon]|nr:hypothetical protein [Candidatus Nanoarchaeia archaeon]
MPNKSKLVRIFIGNIANAVVHEVLENAIEEQSLRSHYGKEMLNSMQLARKYREQLNPIDKTLPESVNIRRQIVKKAEQELKLRIKKGYTGINIDSTSKIAEKLLKKLKA